MKNIPVVAMALFALYLSSCSKAGNNAAPLQQQAIAGVPALPITGKFRALWQYDPWRMNCVAIVQNCHPSDIVIRPRLSEVYALFFQTLEGRDNDRIAAFMKANRESLQEDIPADLMDKALDGTYTVHYFYSAENDTRFVLFKTGETVVMALPFVSAPETIVAGQ